MKYLIKEKNYNEENPELALYDLLHDRGIENPEKWLNPTDEYEHNPYTMKDMGKGVRILDSILQNQEANILVVVDSDLDGYSSGAIIISLLNIVSRGQSIDYVLHPGKEHGIELKDIPDDIDLIIVPDAGSSQKEEHLKLLEHGTKIIILDHHEISNDFEYGEYDDNIAIISSQIDYPNPALSGAGVALKFVQAVLQNKGKSLPMKLYALAACGIVADVMDMSDLENKWIVNTGLKYMDENQFLMALIKKAHYNLENPLPSIKDIGWVVGPNINSIIRLGTMEQKHTVFKSLVSPYSLVLSSKKGHEDEEVPIYEEAIRLCDNAKKRQTTAVNRSIKIIEREIDNNHNAIVYIDEDQDVTFELSGLIANKLLSEHKKPVILLREYTNGDTHEYRGSIRGKAAEGLNSFKDTLEGITGVNFVEGHAFAAGIGIDFDNIQEFRLHLDEALNDVDFNSNLYMVDLIAKSNEVNRSIASIMGRDDIWCHGVEKPLVAIEDVPVFKYDLMGTAQQHIKIDCGQYDIILFNTPELSEKLLNNEKFNLTVVGEFDIDKAYNIGRLQLIVSDYEKGNYVAPDIWSMVF